MSTLSGFGESSFGPQVWSPIFAKEPEEEADYDDLPETQEERPVRGSTVRRSVPPKQKKPSGMRPLVLLLLLVLIGGVAYVVMTPGAMPPFLAEFIGLGSPEMSSTPPAGPPAKAAAPGQPSPPPLPPPSAAAPESPGPDAPAHDQSSAVPPGTPPASPPTAGTSPAGSSAPPTQTSPVPAPAFGEGQMVFVALDPTLPVGMMVLSGDAVGSKPGPSVRPGAQVIVLDAEYMPNGWIYSVRTPDGSVGWISEKRLKVGR